MGYSNLPPGVKESDIPGNRPEDNWNETVWNLLDEDILAACDKDESFELKIEDDIDDYSTDNGPEYVAYCVSSSHIDQALMILGEL